MTDEELNTALYEKMFAEQEKYREWLLSQPPEEILNHTYEYTMREDILLSLEYDDIDGALAQALLSSPCPLEEVFRAFESVEDGHMAAIRDCIIDRAGKELEKQRSAPIYAHDAAYAREHGEADEFRASATADENCRAAIENAIARNYDGWNVNAKAAIREVREQFGVKRMVRVTASLVANRPHDERIRPENRAWAEKNASTKKVFTDRTHSGLLDIFTTRLREDLARSRGAER